MLKTNRQKDLRTIEDPEECTQETIDLINDLVNNYGYINKLTANTLSDNTLVKHYPAGDKIDIFIIDYDNETIGCVLDFGDHAIVSYYYEGDHGKSKDNTH